MQHCGLSICLVKHDQMNELMYFSLHQHQVNHTEGGSLTDVLISVSSGCSGSADLLTATSRWWTSA